MSNAYANAVRTFLGQPVRSGLTYRQALTALIDEQYAQSVKHTRDLPAKFHTTRDEVATGRENIRIAYQLFGEPGVEDAFYEEIWDKGTVTFGYFDNCREYGLTVEIGDWTFCAYEHRNSDNICIEGCPTAEVKSYGPYGGEDKYDTLGSWRWKDYDGARDALIAMMKLVQDAGTATRRQLKAVAKQNGGW